MEWGQLHTRRCSQPWIEISAVRVPRIDTGT
jgi:hypothetical protein